MKIDKPVTKDPEKLDSGLDPCVCGSSRLWHGFGIVGTCKDFQLDNLEYVKRMHRIRKLSEH